MNMLNAVVIFGLDVALYIVVYIALFPRLNNVEEALRVERWNNMDRETKFCYRLLYGFLSVVLIGAVYGIPPSGSIIYLIYKLVTPVLPILMMAFLWGFFVFMTAGESWGVFHYIVAIIAPIIIWVSMSIHMLMMIDEKIPISAAIF